MIPAAALPMSAPISPRRWRTEPGSLPSRPGPQRLTTIKQIPAHGAPESGGQSAGLHFCIGADVGNSLFCRMWVLCRVAGVLGLGDPRGEDGQALPWAAPGRVPPRAVAAIGGDGDNREWVPEAQFGGPQ
jgi:hypothetical protein